MLSCVPSQSVADPSKVWWSGERVRESERERGGGRRDEDGREGGEEGGREGKFS